MEDGTLRDLTHACVLHAGATTTSEVMFFLHKLRYLPIVPASVTSTLHREATRGAKALWKIQGEVIWLTKRGEQTLPACVSAERVNACVERPYQVALKCPRPFDEAMRICGFQQISGPGYIVRRVVLERGPSSGFGFCVQTDSNRVTHVTAGLSAEQHGLRIGDEIYAVNSHALHPGLPCAAVMPGKEETTVALTIRQPVGTYHCNKRSSSSSSRCTSMQSSGNTAGGKQQKNAVPDADRKQQGGPMLQANAKRQKRSG